MCVFTPAYFNDWRKKTPVLVEIGGDTPLANILMIAGATEGQCQTVAVLNSFVSYGVFPSAMSYSMHTSVDYYFMHLSFLYSVSMGLDLL